MKEGVMQLDRTNQHADFLINNTFGCDTIVLTSTRPTDAYASSHEIKVVYPNVQWLNKIVVPATQLNRSWSYSIRKLLSANQASVWIAWLVSAALLVLVLWAFSHEKESRWTFVRALLPGQASSIPVPQQSLLKPVYVFFMFFIGNLALGLYGNTIAVQLQSPQPSQQIKSVEELLELVAKKQLTFVGTFDWKLYYDTQLVLVRQLQKALAANPIKVIGNRTELFDALFAADDLIYLDYEVNVFNLWKEYRPNCERPFYMVDASELEAGGWYSYIFRRSPKIDQFDFLKLEMHIKSNLAYFSTILESYVMKPLCMSETAIHEFDKSGVSKPMSTGDLDGLFWLLALGLFGAACAFVMEMRVRYNNYDVTKILY